MNDLKFAFRQLLKNPGFTAVAVLTLALGIGASVAIFAFADAALLKPLPYHEPNRLVGVYERTDTIPRSNLSYPDYVDWKQRNEVFQSLEVWTGSGYLVATPEGAQSARGARVSAGFFRSLGVTPVLGRVFRNGEDAPGAPQTVVLSHAAWQRWFGGRAEVLGQPVSLSGIPYEIIGVLPREFHFVPRGQAEFWTSLQPVGDCELRRSCHNLYGVARLEDGVSIQMAAANLTSIAKQLEDQFPDSNRGQSAAVISLAEAIVGDVSPLLLTLLGGAGLLLLIACVNVASLLLVRTESRRREFAVRGALGASPARLARHFLTEGFVLAASGSVLGLIAAGWAMQALAGLIPTDMLARLPYLQGLGFNFRVLAFAGAISLLAAMAFTFVPALRLSVSDLCGGLADSGRGSAGTTWRRFGSKLVVVELAIAMVLLVGAGLLGKSFHRLLQVELHFQPDQLATLQVAAPETGYGKNEQVVRLGREIVSRISNLPGVKSAAISSLLPVNFNGNTDWIRFEGRPYNGEHNEVNLREVSSEYLVTLQAKLLRGRYFSDTEDASKPRVVIINQALAKLYFPNEDPIGRRIGDTSLSPDSIKEIIGIVDDIKEGSLDSDIWPAVYYPFNQSPGAYFSVVVRTSQSAQSLLPTLAATIHQIDPALGTMGESTMRDRINDSPSAYMHRTSAWLVGGFAATALLLGVVGLYGVIAYSVGQRTGEIGVRMALGAGRYNVYRLILKEAGWLTVVGIVIGLVSSVGTATFMRKLLFGTEAWDVATLATVATLLGFASLVASYIPARRASRINPMEALRNE